MKFAAAATAVLAGVAQAAVANDAINQGQSANAVGAAGMDGMTLLTGLYGMENMKGYGGGGGGLDFKDLLQKAGCALPCVEKALRKTKCQGNPLDTLCNNIDSTKEKAEPCLKKCDIDASLTDLVVKGSHFICDKRSQGSKKEY